MVFCSSHVTDQSGTGLVHSAPAHGHDDYIAFSKAGLLPGELRCPVDDAGCFTDEVVGWAGNEEARALVGKSVLGDGVDVMVDLLRRQNALLGEEIIEHRYPLDWKTKEPIIVR
jgi:isoleucyl-tRNA synthetase